jgi:organic radical activating enzyme
MFGTNTVAHAMDPKNWDGKYFVTEIFDTIQGEGPFSGYPAIFVRFATCNLRCHFCDTDFDKKMEMTSEEIFREIKSLHHKQPVIVLTGGEPMIQPLKQLIDLLHTRLQYKTIQIETAGTVYLENLNQSNIRIVVSPKTPEINHSIRTTAHYWKYVISARDEHCPETGVPITSTQPGGNRTRLAIPPPWLRPIDIFLMPQEGPDEDMDANYAKVAQLAMKHGYRASARLHTILRLR